MLEIIYTSVGLLTVTLALAFLVFINIKEEFSIAKKIKCLIVISGVLCVLFIIQAILAIVLAKSDIGSNIFCAVILALYVVMLISNLKTGKDETPTIRIHFIIKSCFDNEDEETGGKDTSEKTENK